MFLISEIYPYISQRMSVNTHQTSMLTDEEATLYDRQIRLWGADAQLK